MVRTPNTEVDKIKKEYEMAVQLANNESQVVWQYSEAYILANTIVIGFIAQNYDKNFIVILLSFLGLILSVVWLGSSERRWGWFVFRMAQASNKEKTIGYNLIGRYGLKFSEGKEVIINGKSYRLNWLARIFKTQRSTRIFIILFMAFYFAMLVVNQKLFTICIRG